MSLPKQKLVLEVDASTIVPKLVVLADTLGALMLVLLLQAIKFKDANLVAASSPIWDIDELRLKTMHKIETVKVI